MDGSSLPAAWFRAACVKPTEGTTALRSRGSLSVVAGSNSCWAPWLTLQGAGDVVSLCRGSVQRVVCPACQLPPRGCGHGRLVLEELCHAEAAVGDGWAGLLQQRLKLVGLYVWVRWGCPVGLVASSVQ